MLLGAAAMLFGFSWLCADAAVVHPSSSEEMQHTYGRAGVPIASDAVSEASSHTGSVDVTYSEAVAEWTNMHRSEAQEGPVRDGLDATGSHGVDHWFGRTGGPVGADEISSPESGPAAAALIQHAPHGG
jgi:hypothetical protein